MEMIGAGLAALGVIGPGIGIGILTGLSTAAIGRNPDAAAQIRATFIIGAGVIALFVGVIEFFLEFIKPVTLAMRLFGNIYGGEVALGVITGLTIAIIPVAMVGLEFLLNFMQALIFSVLTLMFTIIAIERHDGHEEHDVPEGNIAPPIAPGQAAAAH